MQLRNSTVIVTGASRGIGAATAAAFAAAGARVLLAARDTEALDRVAAAIGPAAIAVPMDVTDPDACRALAARAAEFGRIDVVVHNAGVGLAAPVAKLHATDLQRVLQVNVFGPLALTQAVLPMMRAQRQGQLMFVSSVVGLRALPYMGGYAASKAALDRLVESLRVELIGSGVGVTLIRPGTTDTGFAAHRLGAGAERRQVRQRGIAPEQVAARIVRGATRRSRTVYVTWADRVMVAAGIVVPGLVDRILARAITWTEDGAGE